MWVILVFEKKATEKKAEGLYQLLISSQSAIVKI